MYPSDNPEGSERQRQTQPLSGIPRSARFQWQRRFGRDVRVVLHDEVVTPRFLAKEGL
jgi:hypothetical protein